MKEIQIDYNPYRVETKVFANGEDITSSIPWRTYRTQRFQDWVDCIPQSLKEQYPGEDLDITFHGTELDFEDIDATIKNARKRHIPIRLKGFWPAKPFGQKEKELEQLFNEIQKLPFSELKDEDILRTWTDTLKQEFEVMVVATMSAGKSTLVNALLGRTLMPSQVDACTATVSRIKDNDCPESISAVAFDRDGNKKASYDQLDQETMKLLNSDPSVNTIDISCDIPFVTANEDALVLIDTPGPNNACDSSHHDITYRALDASSKALILFVMNGTTLHSDDEDLLLRQIAKSMSEGGKQSRERFLFVVNKMDVYHKDDNIEGKILPEVKSYLEERGIQDPQIFLLSSEAALLIRKYLATSDEEKREEIWEDEELEFLVRKLNRREDLHLEKYASLNESTRRRINRELKEAKKKDDKLGEALIHSGIRGLEEMIRTYVTKYSRPYKIKQFVDLLDRHLDAFHHLVEMKNSCNKSDFIESLKDLSEYRKQAVAFQKRLSANKDFGGVFFGMMAFCSELEKWFEKANKSFDQFYKLASSIVNSEDQNLAFLEFALRRDLKKILDI